MPFNLFKKKKPIFGTNIKPDCLYCKHNMGKDNKIVCLKYTHKVCKKYAYDPLKREPLKKPILKEYSQDDFKL